MGEAINAGVDCHKKLGKEVMMANGGSPSDGVDYRQLAKAGKQSVKQHRNSFTFGQLALY